MRAAAAAIGAALLLLACLATGAAAGSGKVLLLGPSSIADTHSQLIGGLKGAGFEVDVRAVKDDGLALRRHDEWLYDSVVLLAPKAAKLGGQLTKQALVDFVDSGRNLVLAASAEASDFVRGLAAECGVQLDAKGTAVFDHFSHQADGGADDATLVATTAVVDSPAIFGGSPPAAPVLFRGVAAVVPAGSELVTVALSGGPAAYSADVARKQPAAEPPALAVGGAAALVSLVQARNNARVLVSGSLDLLSDALFDAPVTVAGTGEAHARSGNREFALGAALWALGDRGVLKAGELRHRLFAKGGAAPPQEEPPLYRVNDEVEVSLDVQLVEGGKARPYEADDLQVSFVMLDPYVRQPMGHDGNGTFSLRFTVPDVYGVFKYSVDYGRLGYSRISQSRTVPVRPFKHDEYARFLVAAYPYYASVASTMGAFLLLGFVYLYSR